MQESLVHIMNSYLDAKEQEFAGNSLGDYVRQIAPKRIQEKAVLSDRYLVNGSVGQGNWAEIPWICVFDRQITTSAQRGYYIVYLFIQFSICMSSIRHSSFIIE